MNQQRAAGLLQDVFQLVRAICRIDIDQDRADPGGGVLDQHPLVTIGCPNANSVALGNAAAQEGARYRVHLVPEFAIGRTVALVGDDQGLAIWYTAYRAADVRDDSLA